MRFWVPRNVVGDDTRHQLQGWIPRHECFLDFLQREPFIVLVVSVAGGPKTGKSCYGRGDRVPYFLTSFRIWRGLLAVDGKGINI